MGTEEDMVCAISSISGRVHIEFGPSTLETTDADAPDINCLTAQAQTDEQVDADNTNCGERERERERERNMVRKIYNVDLAVSRFFAHDALLNNRQIADER
jgi:hypothetical protein